LLILKGLKGLVLLIGKNGWRAVLLLCPALAANPVQALPDLPRQTLALGGAELQLDADLSGALVAPIRPGGQSAHGAGAASLLPDLRLALGDGPVLTLDGVFTVTDTLSRDVYDGDLTERLMAGVRTGLGTFSMGIGDGAGSVLSVAGPQVQHDVSINDPRTSFFRDPRTGRAVTNLFALRTPVGISTNDTKFLYASPEYAGIQLALSFTPSQSKSLPFLETGPNVPGRQAAIWEAGLRYGTELDAGFGPVLLTGYGAVAQGHARHRLPGQNDVRDLGFGLRGDYAVTDTVSLSLGGAWRQSNAWTFDIEQVWQDATTQGRHIAAMLRDGDWSAGLEYGDGVAGAVPQQGLPRLGLDAAQASLGYQVNRSLQVTAGWQHLRYTRDSGAFFTGGNRLSMDAVYLHLKLRSVE